MIKKPRGVSPIFLDEKPQHPATVGYTRRRIVFGWYGGKFSHLDWLQCHHYCLPVLGPC